MNNIDTQVEQLIERLKQEHIADNLAGMAAILLELHDLSDLHRHLLGRAAVSFYNGLLDLRSGNLCGAIEFMKATLEISINADLPYYTMKANNSLGIIMSMQSDYYTGLSHYLEAYKIAEAHPEFKYSTILHNNIGSLFVWLDENELALRYFYQSYDLYHLEEQDDMPMLCNLALNVAELSLFAGRLDQIEHWITLPNVEYDEDAQLMISCLRIARNLFECGNNHDVERMKLLIPEFMPFVNDAIDYVFIFRASMCVLKHLIAHGLRSECDSLITAMEAINVTSSVRSFDYNFSELKAQYYMQFIAGKYPEADYYLSSCWKEGTHIIAQLKHAYSRSMLAEIELNHSQSANQKALKEVSLLQKNIHRDSFTELLNKVGIKEHITDCLAKFPADALQSLFIIDIDFFKTINDTYGHLVGDETIAHIGEMLRSVSSDEIVAGRFGGDEFVVYLSRTTHEETKQFAERLIKLAHAIKLPDDRIAHLTLSIGVGMVDSSMGLKDILIAADEALYASKHNGRNCYTIYNKAGS